MKSALKILSFTSLLLLGAFNVQAALWTPAEIGLLRWYDASDTGTITLVNTNDVSQWNAKVGATNLTQTTAGFRPKSGTRTINSLNTVEFDGVDDRMAIGATLTLISGAPTKRDIWSVIELDDTTDEPILATSSSELSVVSNQLKFYGGGLGCYSDTRSSDIGTTPSILGFIGDSFKKYSINGTLETTASPLTGLLTNRIQVNQVGFRATGSALDGAIGEIIITSAISSTDTRLRIEGYLAWKWGLQSKLPSDHLYKNSAPTTSTYTLTFDTDGGSAVAPITDMHGSTVTPPADPTKEGYTFTGWSPSLPATMPEGDATYTAQWSINQYTITFDSDGGTPVDPITQDYGTPLTDPTPPTKEGYVFGGWNPALHETMHAHDDTHIAIWTVDQFVITFDSHMGTAVDPIIDDFGATITPPADPTLEGHTFTGWDPVLPLTMPAINSHHHAQWTANPYTLTFDTDGGSSIADITQDYGTSITAPTNPTKTGYTFVGWSPSLPATIPAGNATYTAQWTLNQYTLTFDTDGGSAVSSIVQDYNTAITPPADPTKEGYNFTGWSPTIPSNIPEGDATYTAQWTINQYTLSFDSDGGSAVADITQDYDTAITAPTDPTKEGYNFTAWDPALPLTMPATNQTHTAQWIPVSGGGGGGGGGGSGGGSGAPGLPLREKPIPKIDTPIIHNSAPFINIKYTQRYFLCSSDIYPTQYIRLGQPNDPEQVKLLEKYLTIYEGEYLAIDGIYSFEDAQAVIRWQEKYASDILTPWGITRGTGYIYQTSLKKFQELFEAQCQKDTITFTK